MDRSVQKTIEYLSVYNVPFMSSAAMQPDTVVVKETIRSVYIALLRTLLAKCPFRNTAVEGEGIYSGLTRAVR